MILISRSLWFISLIFLSNFSAQAQSLSLEQRAIRTGTEALRWFNVLHQSAEKCGVTEYTNKAPLSVLEALISERFNVSLPEFEKIAEANPSYRSIIELEVGRLDCNDELVAVLNDFYEEYDLARFNLEIYDPLEKPLSISDEPKPTVSRLARPNLVTLAEQAESIFIAELIHRDAAPAHFDGILQSGGYSQDYIVQVLAGWKQPAKLQFLFLSPTQLQQISSAGFEAEIEAKGKINLLMFIRNPSYSFTTDDVIELINVDEKAINVGSLGAYDWEWIGKRLIN